MRMKWYDECVNTESSEIVMKSAEEKKGRLRMPHSFKRSMFFALFMVIIAMLSILLFYIFGIVRKADQQSRDLFLQAAAASRIKLEEAVAEDRQDALQAAYTNAVQNALLSTHPETVILGRSMAMDTIDNVVSRSHVLHGIVLCAANGRRLSSATQSSEIMDLALDAAGLSYASVFSDALMSPSVTYNQHEYYVSLHPIYGSLNGYHSRGNQIILGIIFSVDNVKKQLPLTAYPEAAVVLTAPADGSILLSTRELSEEEARLLSELEKNEEGEIVQPKNYFISHTRFTLSPFDMDIFYLLPVSITGSFTMPFDSLPFFLILLFILLISIMMFVILLAINKDVNGFVRDIHAVENGASSVAVPRVEELSVISNTLNDTLAKLQQGHEREQQLLTMNYEAELAQNRAELLAYRSQINPHFLFNTLESARSLAHHYKVAPVEQLISGMSRMFQASLYSPMIVPLKDELDALDGYISVIEVRFPGRYQIEKYIEENTLTHPVLSVLLQPLLENTIQHAFTGRRNGHVVITAAYEDETSTRLKITMKDDGIGMSEEDLNAIIYKMKHSMEDTAAIHEENDKLWLIDSNRDISIGLTNIYRRLKLTFGEHAHINITSEKDAFTSVELLIPLIETQLEL